MNKFFIVILTFAFISCSMANSADTTLTSSGYVESPKLSVGLSITDDTYITIFSSTENALIYYTDDGSIPSTSSSRYDSDAKPLISSTGITIRAIAVKSGMYDSSITEKTFDKLVATNTSEFTISGTSITAFTGSATEVVIPNNITSINGFSSSSITSVVIPDSVTTIGDNCFNLCSSLVNVNIPESVTSLGATAFGSCTSLIEISIPDSLTAIGNYTFRGCTSLTTIKLPKDLTTIGTRAFALCSLLEEIIIPDTVNTFSTGVFTDCSALTTVNIPEGITLLNHAIFQNCTSLNTIVMPITLSELSHDAFSGCTSLVNIKVKSITPPTLESSAFNNIASNPIFNVPQASLNLYKTATNWSVFEDYFVGF